MLANALPMAVYPAAAIRQHEAEAAADCGVAMFQLMERAGWATFHALQRLHPQPGALLVLAGKGNNGGDGYILARLARAHGWQVRLAQVGPPEALKGDAARAKQAWCDAGGRIEDAEQLSDWQADVIADGLLGTGLTGEVRAPFAGIIDQVNASSAKVLAIDIPSGLCADSGRILGRAVRADATVTFVGLKAGLLTGQAAAVVGTLAFSDLGVGLAFDSRVATSVSRCGYGDLSGQLGQRSRISHKGEHGRVLLIGGSGDMPGAIRLAGEACLRSGAGLVRLACDPAHGAALIMGCPELMLESVADPAQLVTSRDWADVQVLGPGLGRGSWSQAVFTAAVGCELPQVVDADGLYWLAQHESVPQAQRVLTPHAGEAARLLGVTIDIIQQDRLAAARAIVDRFGGICVLKGPGTLIADQNRIRIAEHGNPGMASGGMGDVLSGIIGALMAQGLEPFEAASLGVCIHGKAADMAAGDAERGLLASDLMPLIRELVNPTTWHR